MLDEGWEERNGVLVRGVTASNFGGMSYWSPPEETRDVGERRCVRGPLYGWRWWRSVETKDGWRLASTATNYVWGGPSVVGDEPAPVVRSPLGTYGRVLRGFHCYDSRDVADRLFKETLWGTRNRRLGVLGCIEVSGVVVRHELGYRAQRATIQSLTMFEWDWEEWTDFGWMRQVWTPRSEMIRDFEDVYQVDVMVERRIDGDDVE